MKTTFIYALCEPGTRTVRYIGKADDPKKRLRDHRSSSVKKKTPLGEWLRSLILRAESPDLIILRGVPVDLWEIAEERYIRLARGCGMDLVNSNGGGGGVVKHTLETREKLSAKQLGTTRSPETRKKMSGASKGVPKSPEHRASLSKALIGRPKAPEHCAAIKAKRALQTNNRGPSEWSEKRWAAFELQKGVPKGPLSESHKAAVSAGKIAANARRRERDQEIEWALAPYTLE